MIYKYKYVFVSLLATIAIVYIFFTSYSEPEYLKFVEFKRTYNTSHMFDLEFKYIINNNCTTNSAIKAIQIVTSFAGSVEARSALRRAYPKQDLENLGIYRVFLLAQLKPGVSEVTQSAILNENDRYNDIVQGNFLENYRNLTYKHVMGIQWAVTQCNSTYVIKMDDDIVVDMYSLVDLIDSKGQTNFDLLGYVLQDLRPIRLMANKWYVTEDEYESDSYPTFVSGWLYIATFDAAKRLLYSLNSEKYFWIDDVFVTGVLGRKANLKIEDMQEYFTTNPEYFECCMRDKVECGFIAGPSGGEFNINIDFQRHSKKCHKHKCKTYTNGKTFKNSCIVSRKLPIIGKGFAKLDAIKL